MSETPATPNGGSSSASIVRQGFGETSVERRGETQQTAAAAQARALVEARYVVALRNPRDLDDVRAKLLRDCKRPHFAERAFFSVPRGDKPGRFTGLPGRIEGLSVRFAEAAVRALGNVWQDAPVIFEDERSRTLRVSVTDLERNNGFSRDLTIGKTVERRKVRDGQIVLGQRQNSSGDTVYILQATEDELLQREGALVSKTIRTAVSRLVPADITDECEQEIMATIRKKDAEDPDAARKLLADAFAVLGVQPSDLKAYLGHDLGSCSPAELAGLRGIYVAIRDGDTTWAEVAGSRGEPAAPKPAAPAGPQGAEPPAGEAKPKSRAKRVAEQVAQQTSGGAASPAPGPLAASTGAAPSPSPGAEAPKGAGSSPKQTTIPGTDALQPAYMPPAAPAPTANEQALAQSLVDAWNAKHAAGTLVTWTSQGKERPTRTMGRAYILQGEACVMVEWEGAEWPAALFALKVRG